MSCFVVGGSGGSVVVVFCVLVYITTATEAIDTIKLAHAVKLGSLSEGLIVFL